MSFPATLIGCWNPNATIDLLDADWWRGVQADLRTGEPVEVLSYSEALRFRTTPGA